MFYRKTIEELRIKIFSLKSKCNVLGDITDELQTKVKALEQMDEGLLECVKNDRKDLTLLINMIKNNKTTTKKGRK